jgi:hypothetical protein
MNKIKHYGIKKKNNKLNIKKLLKKELKNIKL